jgi:hypothetical protein
MARTLAAASAGTTGMRPPCVRELGEPNTLLALVAKLPKLIKTKKRCCKSGPRCKRCPVVCKRLEKQGVAERVELRVYRITGDVKKKQLAAARAR